MIVKPEFKDPKKEEEAVVVEAIFEEIEDVQEVPEDLPMPDLVVRVVMLSGSLDFTIHGYTLNEYKQWISSTMASYTDGGYYIGDVFIQDSKLRYFEAIKQ